MWEDNYWQPVHELVFEKFMLDEFEQFRYLTKPQRYEAMHGLSLLKQKDISTLNKSDFFDMENGMLSLLTGELVPHSKKYLSTIRIPYKYEPSAKCGTWLTFLDSSLEGKTERIELLQEWLGYCLGKDNHFHKAMVLLGDGRNGKGTTCHILRNLVGEFNCTSLKLGQMTNENMAARLANKMVNIDADTDTSAVRYEADFRRITGGDSIMVKNLYDNPYELRPYVKLVIGANDLPHIADKTHGLYDRLLIIPYNVSFVGREDFGLKEKLMAELSGILNWCLIGRKRLYIRGRFSETNEMRELVQDLKKQNNPIDAYVDECVGIHDDAETTKQDLYDNYKSWCKQNGYKEFGKNKFGKEFYRAVKPRTLKDARRSSALDNAPIWPKVYIQGKFVATRAVAWPE